MKKEDWQKLLYRTCLVALAAIGLYMIAPEQIALRAGCGPNQCESGYEFLHRGQRFVIGRGQVFHMSRIEALVNVTSDRTRARLEIYSEGDPNAERSYSQAVELKPHPGNLAGVRQIDVTDDVNAPEIGAPGLRLCFKEREGMPIVCPDSGVTIRGTLTPPLYRVFAALQRAVGL